MDEGIDVVGLEDVELMELDVFHLDGQLSLRIVQKIPRLPLDGHEDFTEANPLLFTDDAIVHGIRGAGGVARAACALPSSLAPNIVGLQHWRPCTDEGRERWNQNITQKSVLWIARHDLNTKHIVAFRLISICVSRCQDAALLRDGVGRLPRGDLRHFIRRNEVLVLAFSSGIPV